MTYSATTSSDVTEHLREAVADAAALPLSCLSREEVAAWLCELQSLRSALEGLACAATVAADDAAVAALHGQRTVASFVAGRTSSDPKQIGSDRVLGYWVRDYPVFADAFAAGELTRRHIQALKDACNPRTRLAMSTPRGTC